MLTEQEKKIVEVGNSAGKSKQEILGALAKFRSQNGMPVQSPIKTPAEPAGPSNNPLNGKDISEDFMGIGEGALEQFGKAGKNIVNIVTDKDKTIPEKIVGVGSEAFRRGGRFIGNTYMQLAKMILPQSWEDKLKEVGQGTVEEVQAYNKKFLEENKDDPSVQKFMEVVDRYKTDPKFKEQVDNAGGFVEGLAEILGTKKITPATPLENIGKEAIDTGKGFMQSVRKLEPELDVPYFQEAEKGIAEGITNTKRGIVDTGIDVAVASGQKIAQTYRDLVEGTTKRISDNLDRQALRENTGVEIPAVEANIGDMYVNAVSPGVKGKKQTLSGLVQNKEQAVSAIKNITESKPELQFRDIETNQIIKGELPSNLWEFGGAITHQKSTVYQKVLEGIGAAADAPVDSTRIVDAMDEIINDPVYAGSPQVVSRAKEALNQFMMNDYTPAQVERLIQLENDRLQAYYRGAGTQGDAVVSAIVANNLRDLLDETVEAAAGEGVSAYKKQYGALKAIERDVVHRALHNAQAREAGLVDMFGIRTIGDVAGGLAGDLGALKRGAAQIAGEGFIKALNDRDALIRRMFLVADQTYNKAPNLIPNE